MVCMCVHACMYAGMYECIPIDIHVCRHTCMNLYVHISGWAVIGRHICMYGWMDTAELHEHIYLCTHTYTHAYLYTECNSWENVFQ